MPRARKLTVGLIVAVVMLYGLAAPAVAGDQVDTEECTYSIDGNSIDSTSDDTDGPSTNCGGGGGICNMMPNCDATDV